MKDAKEKKQKKTPAVQQIAYSKKTIFFLSPIEGFGGTPPTTAYGFLTRGCPRGCPFCVVGGKEGRASYKVANISEWWGGQENIKLLYPNLLTYSEHLKLLRQLAKTGAYIDITQGLDARLLTEKNISLINKLKTKALHFAWDNPRDKSVTSALIKFRQLSKIKNHRKLIVYVLCNYWSNREEDLYRIYWLRDNGFDPLYHGV